MRTTRNGAYVGPNGPLELRGHPGAARVTSGHATPAPVNGSTPRPHALLSRSLQRALIHGGWEGTTERRRAGRSGGKPAATNTSRVQFQIGPPFAEDAVINHDRAAQFRIPEPHRPAATTPRGMHPVIRLNCSVHRNSLLTGLMSAE